MNTHGSWMLCKFMVTEGNECMRFHDIASGSQIPNPQTGNLVSFESELTNHSKQKKFHQKHQKPDTDTTLFYKGVQLEAVPMGPKIDRNPTVSGSQSFTPARDAELLKQHVTGSQLAVYQGSASAATPVKKLQQQQDRRSASKITPRTN